MAFHTAKLQTLQPLPFEMNDDVRSVKETNNFGGDHRPRRTSGRLADSHGSFRRIRVSHFQFVNDENVLTHHWTTIPGYQHMYLYRRSETAMDFLERVVRSEHELAELTTREEKLEFLRNAPDRIAVSKSQLKWLAQKDVKLQRKRRRSNTAADRLAIAMARTEKRARQEGWDLDGDNTDEILWLSTLARSSRDGWYIWHE